MSKIKKANSKVSKKTENFKIELDGETITVDKEALRPFLPDSTMELIEMDEDERQHRYEIEEAIGIVEAYQGGINDLPAKLKNNREVVMAAVGYLGENLQYVKKSFRKDKEIVMAAVQSDGDAIRYADESLQKDPEILKAAGKMKP